jgi:carboxymethylenebutenolidase
VPGQDVASPTSAQQAMAAIWEEHMKGEFATRSVEETLATMTEDAHVNHVPVLTGAVGRDACGDFYGRWFIPHIPPDFAIVPISRTIGDERLVDEFVLSFTHSMRMDWLLPGIPPTGRRVEVPFVAIIHIRDGKVASEHIYWDQAAVLVQVGLLDPATLPVAGPESAHKVLDPTSVPSNALIARAEGAG